MPIVVTCPGCPTKLSAPESAAGKQIRCPKCGATAPVPTFIPAEEVPVVEAAVVAPAPKPKRVVADADDDDRPRKKAQRDSDDEEAGERPRKKKKPRYADDDDDYEHDHPRRRQRRGGGGGGSRGGVIVAVVIAGVLLVALIGVGIYYLTGKGSLFAKRTPVPPGWQQYTYSQDGFKAYLPKSPTQVSIPTAGLQNGRMGGGPFGGRNELQDMEAVTMYTSGNFTDPVHVEVMIIRFRSRVPAAIRDQLRDLATKQLPGAQTRSVRWLGSDAVEATVPAGVARVVCVDRTVILASISGPNNTRAKAAEEDGFFDNFELTK